MNRPSDLAPFPHSEGISAYELDASSGAMALLFEEPAARLESPTFLTVHPSRNVLYAVSSGTLGAPGPEDVLSAYRIRPDGRLELISWLASGGKNPCFVTVHPNEKWLFAPNYSSGSTLCVRLHENGELAESQLLSHAYLPPDPNQSKAVLQRLDASHPHCCVPSPDGHFLIICDLGSNGLWSCEPASNASGWQFIPGRNFTPAPAGSGPRHAVFSQRGDRLYVFNELSCTLDLYGFHSRTGELTQTASLPVLRSAPNGNSVPAQCAEIVLHPNGRFLFLSMRHADTISVFRETEGGVEFIQQLPAGGEIPRFITFDPTGRLLLACCQKTGRIFSFWVNPESGHLTPTGFSVFAPWCAALAFSHDEKEGNDAENPSLRH